jgi:hypothetical protein
MYAGARELPPESELSEPISASRSPLERRVDAVHRVVRLLPVSFLLRR